MGWTLAAAALMLLPPRAAAVPAPARAAGPVSRPILVVALIAAVAAGPLVFGLVPGLVASACAVAAMLVAVRRAGRSGGGELHDPGVPLLLDLVAAALGAGRPPADAVGAAAPAVSGELRERFEQIAGLLRLGATPAQAWAVLGTDGPLGAVATVAVRSAASGAKLAGAFGHLASELRAENSAAAAARAQRAGVVVMAPLGACFLPSFVLLGVVPVVVGIARSVFGGLS